MHLNNSIVAFAAVAALFPFTTKLSAQADQASANSITSQPALVDVQPRPSPVWVTAPVEPAVFTEDDERVITIHLGPDGIPMNPQNVANQLSNTPVAPPAEMSHEEKVAQALANRRSRLVGSALTYRGTPYVWGGTTTRGFDCSGFTQYVCRQQGIIIPRTAKQQFNAGKAVSKANLQQGDLVFFNTTGPITHVGMYIGNGKFVHAANPRRGVRVDSLNSGYYANRYAGARRYR